MPTQGPRAHRYRAGWLRTERARPERVRTWSQGWKLAVATVCFGAFAMGQLDASVVTLTYRPVQAEFGAGLAGVEWVSLAYLVALIALVVPVGRLSDIHGRKLVYLYGFAIFTRRLGCLWIGSQLGPAHCLAGSSRASAPRCCKPTAWPWSPPASP